MKENNNDTQESQEEFSVSGDDLIKKIKDLIEEGNSKKIIIKGSDGNTILEFPLNVGVAGGVLGVVFLPTLAAIGAVAAVVTRCTIVIVKK